MSTSKIRQDQVEMRTCIYCGLTRPLTEFRVRRRATGERFEWCQDCRSRKTKAGGGAKAIDASQPRINRDFKAINHEVLAQVVERAKAVLGGVDEKGLIPTQELKRIYLTREQNRELADTAYSATDKIFQDWLLKAIGGFGVSTRLRYRLVMLAVVEELAAISGNHWRE